MSIFADSQEQNIILEPALINVLSRVNDGSELIVELTSIIGGVIEALGLGTLPCKENDKTREQISVEEEVTDWLVERLKIDIGAPVLLKSVGGEHSFLRRSYGMYLTNEKDKNNSPIYFTIFEDPYSDIVIYSLTSELLSAKVLKSLVDETNGWLKGLPEEIADDEDIVYSIRNQLAEEIMNEVGFDLQQLTKEDQGKITKIIEDEVAQILEVDLSALPVSEYDEPDAIEPKKSIHAKVFPTNVAGVTFRIFEYEDGDIDYVLASELA